jgi:hypothetical protein
VRDPEERRADDGTIRTGARRDRVAVSYEPVLAAAVAAIHATEPSASVMVYGSVATGRARSPVSDVDLVAVGLTAAAARTISRDLSGRFSQLCREVAISAYSLEHLTTATDPAYGDRAFLRHYCVHLAGPDHACGWDPFPADTRTARGFNGDIAACARRWRRQLGLLPAPELGRTLARKTLLAVSGLVSIHDQIWTTDRASAAHRWGQLRPEHASSLAGLLSWSEGQTVPGSLDLRESLDDVVPHVVTAFASMIGTWDPQPHTVG